MVMRSTDPEPVRCPIVGCRRMKRDWQAMCLWHWQRVPKNLRDRLWRLYRDAHGTREHMQALQEALDAATAEPQPATVSGA